MSDRPWYAIYALFEDRTEPAYLYGGITPPHGTTPAQAACLKEPRHILYADEQAALYEEPQQTVLGTTTPQKRVIVRYDDLEPKTLGDMPWPGQTTRDFTNQWLKQVPV